MEWQEEAGAAVEAGARWGDAAAEEVLSVGRAESAEESGQWGEGCTAVGVNMEPEMEEALHLEGVREEEGEVCFVHDKRRMLPDPKTGQLALTGGCRVAGQGGMLLRRRRATRPAAGHLGRRARTPVSQAGEGP